MSANAISNKSGSSPQNEVMRQSVIEKENAMRPSILNGETAEQRTSIINSDMGAPLYYTNYDNEGRHSVAPIPIHYSQVVVYPPGFDPQAAVEAEAKQAAEAKSQGAEESPASDQQSEKTASAEPVKVNLPNGAYVVTQEEERKSILQSVSDAVLGASKVQPMQLQTQVVCVPAQVVEEQQAGGKMLSAGGLAMLI